MCNHPRRHPARLMGLIGVFVLSATFAPPAAAQTPDAAPPAPTPVEVELNLINLPTTKSVKRHGSYFRLTHRFQRDLRRGDFGSLAEDLFSLDNGAIIGLEYRFGITSDIQAGVHRSLLSRTIQFFGRYDVWRQTGGVPVSLSLTGAVEGLDNMTEHHQGTVAATVSRAIADRATVYATPALVGGTRKADFSLSDGSNYTMFIGLGGRVRVRPSVHVTGEYSPRVAGYDPERGTWGVAVEKKTGGHTFQINFTNSFGTTFGQIARGGSEHNVYLGFNIVRVF